MGQGASGSAGVVVAAVSSGQLEIIVLGAAAALALTLVALKLWFSRNRRLRKAASAGYHQRDLARYSTHGIGEPADEAGDPRHRPLAPNFAAPVAGHQRSGGAEHPAPVPGARSRSASPRFGTFDPTENLVPAFDSETAERLRPPTPPPSAITESAEGAELAPSEPRAEPPQPVPASDVEEEIPPPAGALPLLQQPPPSPPAEPERHSSAS
jgi:hypothetical protein